MEEKVIPYGDTGVGFRMRQRVAQVIRKHVAEPFGCERGERIEMQLDKRIGRSIVYSGEISD
jgi:hypothetical protein